MRGFPAALGEAQALGCEAMQMLAYRRHHEPSEEELFSFRAQRERSVVRRLIVHSRFVPNLGSGAPERRSRSVELLSRELVLSAALGAEAYVLHAGAYSTGGDIKEGSKLVAESIIRAREKSGVPVAIVLENVPGGGRRIGGRLEELAALLEKIPGAGICLDTAHAWAAGYDLASAEAMLRFLSRAHRLIGSEKVRAFHLNDTRALLGSHREHHAGWGDGFLGSEGLKALLGRPEYASVPGILETPKGGDADRRNLDYVRRLG